MHVAKLSPLVFSIATLGLWACSGGSNGTGTTGTGGTTTGGTSTGGTSGSTSAGDAGLPGLGATCTQGAMPDPCTTNGLACTKGGDATDTCQLPGEFSPCLTSPGCAVTFPPLDCEPGFKLQTGESVSLCLNHCTYTSQCIDALTSCQNFSTTLCFYDFCGPGAMIANGTTFYAPCNNGGTNNGTCMPLLGGGGPGICQASGPVPPWQPCLDVRPDAGRSDLCGVGTTCVMFPMAAGPTATMCAPVCSPSGSGISGPACATGESCISAGPYGYCLTDCAGGQACPSPTSCKGLSVGGQTLQECLP